MNTTRRRTSTVRRSRRPHRHADVQWGPYLDRFHTERAGITERVLAHSRDFNENPYEWAAAAVPVDARVLDVACGSAPLHERLSGWVGMDRSMAELAVARSRQASPLVDADAGWLPVASEAFDAVVCSMSLMLFEPVRAALAEMARVLNPGGRLVVLLPARGPLRAADRWRYGRLLCALRRWRLEYPNAAVLRQPQEILAEAGLVVVEDRQRRFECHLENPELAVLCVRSLYLPGEPPERIEHATRLATSWVGSTLGVPIRRIVAQRQR